MYASLIGAGISQLYDLYQSVTSTKTASGGPSFPTPTDDAASDSSSTASTKSGGGLSDAVHKLMVDLQANSTNSGTTGTDATTTVASDLGSVFKDLKGAGHHHGHGGPHAPSGDPASTGDGADPLNGLASSLLAYAKNQSLGTASTPSTSLTA